MSKVFEIFGKGITVNVPNIIVHWVYQSMPEEFNGPIDNLLKILDCIANRETSLAKAKVAEYLSELPECIYGRMAAAAVCLLDNDLKEAITQTQSIYLRQPANTMALYVLGYCNERLGNIELAVEFYQDCVKFKQYLQLPHQRLAAIYLKEGQIDRAIQSYEILSSEHPEDISSIILLGYLYLLTNDAAKAIDTFNLGILSHPDNFNEALKDDEVQSLINSGMFEQALELVKSTIEEMGLTQDHIIRMGDIYSQGDCDGQAICCYEQAVHMQPNSLEARIKLGTHYLRSNRFSLAAEQFNYASETNDEIVDAYIGLAIAQKLAGYENEAIQTLILASSIQKNSILLFAEAATLQLQSIVDEETDATAMTDKDIVTTSFVLSVYREQLKVNRNRSDIYNKYGIMLLNQELTDKAVEAFEKALSLNPENYRAWHNLVICLVDTGKTKQALARICSNNNIRAGIFQQYYQMTLLYTDKKAFAKALTSLTATQYMNCLDGDQTRANIENMLETLGMVDRSYTSWERINETSTCLLKLREKGLNKQFPSN